MLSVYFENFLTHHRRHIEPLAALRIAGATMYGGAEAIAVYHGGLWHVGREHYFLVAIASPATIQFENGPVRSAVWGPFDPAWLVNGAIRAGETQELALARLDEQTGAWHVYADGTFWSGVVFTAP